MPAINFEHKITAIYLFLGSMWISFSDRLLKSLILDIHFLTQVQTYKGWFYVVLTGILFYFFIKKHLNTLRNTENELEKHQVHLQNMINEKTENLDKAIIELSSKNKTINQKNRKLKETMEDLKKTQTKLIQTEKMASLGTLTAGIAHEINNPLNYIMGGLTGLESLCEKQNEQNPKIKLYLSSIRTGLERSSNIIAGLNNFSRNNQNKNEKCSLHDILNNSLSIISHELKNKITIIKDYSSTPLYTQGNSGQLHQVFVNILRNASQSIYQKGEICISTKLENDENIIEIADNGCGIPEKQLSKVMDPFFTTKDPGKGTGLGLSISYSIIEDHRGSIFIESQVDKGTSIKISLPRKKDIK